MKYILYILLMIFAVHCSFARKSKAYAVNRFNDLTDIVSVTANVNSYGAKGYIGPAGVGLHAEGLYTRDCIDEKKCYRGNITIPFANGIPSVEIGIRNGLRIWGNDSSTAGFTYWEYSRPGESSERSRNKGVVLGSQKQKFQFPASQWTRIGFTAGLIFGTRVEINPGEALDFVLGIFGLDIYKDDVYIYYFEPSEKIRKLMKSDRVEEFAGLFEKEHLSGDIYVDEYNNTFLHYAAGDMSIKMVKYLIEQKKSDINKVSTLGWSPMGHLTWCSGYSVAEKTSYEKENRVYGFADCPELMDYFESIGASYLYSGFMRDHSPEIIDAVKNEKYTVIENYLYPSKRKSRIKSDGKICFDCVVFPHLEEIKALPGEGGNYDNDSNKYGGMTLLQLAVYYDRPNVVKYLLVKGADPKKKNFRNADAYRFAEMLGRTEILQILPKR